MGFIKRLFCKHNYSRHWEAPTVLNNGKLATLKIEECSNCGKTKTTTMPRNKMGVK